MALRLQKLHNAMSLWRQLLGGTDLERFVPQGLSPMCHCPGWWVVRKNRSTRETMIKKPRGTVCLLEGALNPFFNFMTTCRQSENHCSEAQGLQNSALGAQLFPCRLWIATYIYNSSLISLGLDQHIYVKTLILLLLKTAQSSAPYRLSRKWNIWFSPSNSIFFLVSWQFAQKLWSTWHTAKRTSKSALPYDQLTLQWACSWLHKASQP